MFRNTIMNSDHMFNKDHSLKKKKVREGTEERK